MRSAMRPDDETTRILRQWTGGDEQAGEELFHRLYDEIRRVARRVRLPGSSPLQTTALVHELYLKLAEQNEATWKNRGHFFAVASRILRRIAVDEARARSASKRGGDVPVVSLADLGEVGLGERSGEILALETCLRDLERLDPERARLVELRFYAGLSLEETAQALGQSRATTVRQWRVTKGWLHRQLSDDAPRPDDDGDGP